MGTPTLTVKGRPERVVAFVCGAFGVWWLLFAVPFALSLHGAPRIQSCTQHWKTELQFPTGVVQICFGFFSYVAFNLAPPAVNSHLSLTHYFICFVLLVRCFGVASLLRRCLCVASALLRRCLRVASALLRRLFGVPPAFASLRRRALQLWCSFGATSAQPWTNNAFVSTKTSRPAAPMLICVICGLPVVCKTGSC